LEGNGHVIIGEQCRNFHAWTEKFHKNSSVKVVGVPAEIRTRHLSNKGLEGYRYISLLDIRAVKLRATGFNRNGNCDLEIE
jgi:hypothetical protein